MGCSPSHAVPLQPHELYDVEPSDREEEARRSQNLKTLPTLSLITRDTMGANESDFGGMSAKESTERSTNVVSSSLHLLEFQGYRFIRLVGKGSFGQCYAVERLKDGKEFVMKVIPCMSLEESEQAITEARHMAKARHGNVVSLVDFGVDGLTVYLVMEFCSAGDLQGLLRRIAPSVPPERVVHRWVTHLLRGLAFLHARGIVHRDVKLGNSTPPPSPLTQISLPHRPECAASPIVAPLPRGSEARGFWVGLLPRRERRAALCRRHPVLHGAGAARPLVA